MTLTDEERITVVLRHIDELAKIIRSDQKRKRNLFGNYQSRIETIREILDGTQELALDSTSNRLNTTKESNAEFAEKIKDMPLTELEKLWKRMTKQEKEKELRVQ